MELGSYVHHEPCIGRKPLDIAFVARVDEDGGSVGWALIPVSCVDEVLLVEDMVGFGLEGEVV